MKPMPGISVPSIVAVFREKWGAVQRNAEGGDAAVDRHELRGVERLA